MWIHVRRTAARAQWRVRKRTVPQVARIRSRYVVRSDWQRSKAEVRILAPISPAWDRREMPVVGEHPRHTNAPGIDGQSPKKGAPQFAGPSQGRNCPNRSDCLIADPTQREVTKMSHKITILATLQKLPV